MPTLRSRTTDAVLHPKQTAYYIVAHPPDIGYITYQVHERARDFLNEELRYRDGDEIAWSLVYPLRQIGDLFTLDEGGPGRAAPTENTDVTTPQVSDEEVRKLVAYLERHPDVEGDIAQFELQLRAGSSTYMDSIVRDGYTPTTSPGHSNGTGNDTLDRIAHKYCGDGPAAIEWNGDRIVDFITVADRDGERHRFPKIQSRIPAAEEYRLSKTLYERWGAEIGASEVNSRRYKRGENGFPNHWIGQRMGAPEPELKDANSPRAYFYRTIASRSGRAPGTKAKAAFEGACEYSLEVYKANFPTAVDPQTLSTEYTTVERVTKPWHDFQVPPAWDSAYDGGLPPLIRC